ncbi:hypothetical protein V1477_002353 [Vespula maculifrons]|uniref:Uncharacterized protein n=1 Tax=Vespula maculifrons TaxID=7453 RepID=A0ABD2CW87_VESMC
MSYWSSLYSGPCPLRGLVKSQNNTVGEQHRATVQMAAAITLPQLTRYAFLSKYPPIEWDAYATMA